MESENKNLKPRKAFIMEQLNIDRLTPLQYDGIMRAMDKYAEHYHEVKSSEEKIIKVEFTTDDVINQHNLIGKWLEETKKAYEMEHVEDGDIISYLAQKELGFHQ